MKGSEIMKNSQHTPKHAGDVTKSLKKAAFSYISLFLIVMVLIGTTVSWFTVQDTATLESGVMVFNSGSGLRVNDGEDITNHIKVKNFTLDEASSVDGRNIFLPNGKLQSGVTGDMLYREATAGDKNKKFMYADFKLKGNSAGETDVYIKSYTVTVGDQTFNGSTQITFDDSGLVPQDTVHHEKCPIRIAFIEDSQDTPMVFDPTAIIDQYSKTYSAVDSVSSEGKLLSTKASTSYSFAHNYFINNYPLFRLKDSKSHNYTMVAWLEGTGENCDAYKDKKISIDLELESNWDDMEWITFEDQTLGDSTDNLQQWVGNDKCLVTMTYKDVTTIGEPYRTVVMNPIDYKTVTDKGVKVQQPVKWQAPIPKDVITDITFNRYDPKSEIIYNAWYTNKNVQKMWNAVEKRTHPINLDGKELETSRKDSDGNHITYTAQRGNGFEITNDASQRLSPSVGYWGSGTSSSDDGGSGSVEYVTASIYLNIPDNKEWIRKNLSRDNYKIYAVFDDNTKVELSIEDTTKCDRCFVKDIKLKNGINLKSFSLINPKDSKGDKTLPLNTYYKFETDGKLNPSFIVNNNDTVN